MSQQNGDTHLDIKWPEQERYIENDPKYQACIPPMERQAEKSLASLSKLPPEQKQTFIKSKETLARKDGAFLESRQQLSSYLASREDISPPKVVEILEKFDGAATHAVKQKLSEGLALEVNGNTTIKEITNGRLNALDGSHK